MNSEKIQQVTGKISKGVYIIAARDNDRVNGMTAAAVNQVSFKPLLIMVAIGKGHYTHKMVEKGGVFSVNVLDEKQIDLAKHFGLKSGKEIDKFKDVSYETYATGAPVLKDCLAYLDCKVTASYPAGDHTLFIGEIESCGIKKDAKPLIYQSKDYFG